MKGIDFLGFIALNIGLILMLASGFKKDHWSLSDRLLAGLVAWAWLIVALEIVFGYFGWLYRDVLLSYFSIFWYNIVYSLASFFPSVPARLLAGILEVLARSKLA